MSGPSVPPNTASATQQQQQKIQRIPIKICVNNPIGAPQFAAISSISESGNISLTSASNSFSSTDILDETQQQQQQQQQQDHHLLLPHDPSQQAASLFTAFPHDRGSWNGLVLDRSNPSSDGKTKKIKCFSTWASPDSYKGFLALSAAGGDVTSDEDDDDDEGDEDEDDAEDDENNNLLDNNMNDDDDDENDNNDGDENKKSKKKKKPGFVRKKKNHYAFRKVPDRRPEAWFVLTETIVEGNNSNSNNNQETTAYEMLPLTEVFSCKKREYETEKQQVRPDGKAPKLYFCESTKSGAREEKKEGRREAKMEAKREEEERKKRRRQRHEK